MKVYTVKKARKNYPKEGIEIGDTYYYCTPKSLRKTSDRKVRSKHKYVVDEWITKYAKSHRGEFANNMEDWQIRFTNLEDGDEEDKDELVTEIEEFLEQKRESLDNLPYQLQETHVLTEQVEQLEEFLEEVSSWEGWGE